MALLLNASDSVNRSYTITKPSPTHPLDVNGTGERTENLFDYVAYFSNTFVEFNPYFDYADIQLSPNTTYTFSTNFHTGISGSQQNIRDVPFIAVNSETTPSTAIGGFGDDGSVSVTTLSDGIIRFLKRIRTGSPSTDLADLPTLSDFQNGKWVMCNDGSTALPYEPYGYKIPILNGSTTTPVYLGEVQTVRQIKKYEFTGQETFSRTISSTETGTSVYSIKYNAIGMEDIIDYDQPMPNITYPFFFCSHFVMKTNTSFDTPYTAIKNGEIGANGVVNKNYNRSVIFASNQYNTVDTFQAFLAQQYANGTPVTVYYVLATPQTGVVNEPLMKIGNYADSLNTSIPCTAGENTLDVQTTVQPSEVSAGFSGWHNASEIVHRYQYGEWDGSPPPVTSVVYGWHVDPSIADSSDAVTYLEDAVGMTPVAMGASTFDYGSWEDAFFMPKPCMVRSNGEVAYYLDPNDYSKKADGTPSDVANPDFDGNAMMEWGKIWYKFVGGETDGEGYFYVSNVQVDDSYHCWCNYDSKDNITDHFYTAIYNGTGTTKLRSISGVALTSANGNGGTTVTQEVGRATANNTTADVEWYTDVWADRLLINALLVLIGKSLNTQATFGRGLDTGSQTAKEAYVTGTLDDKGLFWGVTADGDSAVKVFGMENWWACCWRRTAGCISVDGALKIKLTYGTADGSTVVGYNQTGDGYISDGTIPSSSNYVKAMVYNQYGYAPNNVSGGSSSTYYADYFYQNTGTRYLLVGGNSDSGVGAGAVYFALTHAPSAAGWYIAASLSFKPLAMKG